ncbi:MAG: tungstate transporter permease [Chloroflexota bacterium]
MDLLWDGTRQALLLLLHGDRQVIEITVRSLVVSAAATLLSLAVGVPLGMLLALVRFPGRGLVLALVNTGMGMPPVVVGLVLALLLWRSGPLGRLGLIYTPAAMVLAQAILAFPLAAGLTAGAVQSLPPRLRLQILALGASRVQMLWLLAREARLLLLAAFIAAFGAAVSEVGASLQVGGNIKGETRVLTTAIVLETGKGNFELAMALALILLLLVFAVTFLFTALQQRARRV